MKKNSFSIVSLLIIQMLFSLNVFATEGYTEGTVKVNETEEVYLDWDKEHKKIEKLYHESLENWMQKYKTEDVSENERIVDYQISGWNGGKIVGGKLKTTIDFSVTPVTEDTIWNPNGNTVFLVFDIVDGEYIFESASLYPEKYEEFMKAFEEYEKNKDVGVETTGIPADVSYGASENKIDELSDIIFIGSAIVLVIVVVTIIIFKVKKKK